MWLTRIQLAEGSGELSLSGKATRADLVPAYLERLRSEQALGGQTFSRVEVMRAAAPPGVDFVLTAGEEPPAREEPAK